MISVIIPAYNEEEHIEAAVNAVLEEARRAGVEVEVVVVNDGSRDGTALRIAALEKAHPCVRGVHHPENRGFGRSFQSALAVVRHPFVTLVSGDNVVSNFSIANIFRHRGQADVLIAYTVNTETRTRPRYVLSMLFSLVYALTFDLHVRYFQGTPLYPVAALRALQLNAGGYSVLAEINVKLLRQGLTYMEIEGYLRPSNGNKSSAVRIKSLIQEGRAFLKLFWDVRVRQRELYRHRPRRVIPTA